MCPYFLFWDITSYSTFCFLDHEHLFFPDTGSLARDPYLQDALRRAQCSLAVGWQEGCWLLDSELLYSLFFYSCFVSRPYIQNYEQGFFLPRSVPANVRLSNPSLSFTCQKYSVIFCRKGSDNYQVDIVLPPTKPQGGWDGLALDHISHSHECEAQTRAGAMGGWGIGVAAAIVGGWSSLTSLNADGWSRTS